MITLLFSSIQMQECLEFREIQEEQNEFLKEEIKISKNQFKKDEEDRYPTKLLEMKDYLEQIKCCIDCSKSQKAQLAYQLHYQFSKSTMLRYGKMIGYKRSLDKSITLLEELLDELDPKKIKKTDSECKDEYKDIEERYDECYFTPDIYNNDKKEKQLRKRINRDYTDYVNEQKILKNQYKDINIFIKGKVFNEMLEIRDNITSNPIKISLDVPAIFYDKKFRNKFVDKDLETVTDSTRKLFEIQFDRINNLRTSSEILKLTSYDKEKGFYYKIPMVPIIQENRSKSINPDYSYAIVINSGSQVTKHRFELTSRSERKNEFNEWEIDPQDYDWDFTKQEVPFDWTKIEIDDKNDWKYLDSQGTEICSYIKNREKPIDLNPAYEETFIAIHKEENDKIIIYQKDIGDIDAYVLQFLKDEKVNAKEKIIRSLKYLILLLLFGMGYAETI